MTDQPDACNPHPDAPHGFDRNASHSEDRYVCDCESWAPPCHCGDPEADHHEGACFRARCGCSNYRPADSGVTPLPALATQAPDTPDARREKLARISIRERCCADCEPTEVDYALVDAILSAPGIAVVNLPEPDEGRDDWLDGSVHLLNHGTGMVCTEFAPGDVFYHSPDEARALAAALLAAAKAENPEPTTTGDTDA